MVVNEVFHYLYELLEDRFDKQSVIYVYDAYRKNINAIDRCSYDIKNEIRFLDRVINRGKDYLPEVESWKNSRFRKTLFSQEWVKNPTNNSSQFSSTALKKSIDSSSNTKKAFGMYCRKCGAKLLDDSEFCHLCGTRVIK